VKRKTKVILPKHWIHSPEDTSGRSKHFWWAENISTPTSILQGIIIGFSWVLEQLNVQSPWREMPYAFIVRYVNNLQTKRSMLMLKVSKGLF